MSEGWGGCAVFFHFCWWGWNALQAFIQFCRKERRNGKPLIEDPKVREMIARRAVEIEMHRLIAWHAVWWFSQREKLGPKPYDLSGLFGKTFAPGTAKEQMDMLGIYGQLQEGSRWTKFSGQIESGWQTVRSMHAGGTIEIYKNVIAQRGLGLPRPPRLESKA